MIVTLGIIGIAFAVQAIFYALHRDWGLAAGGAIMSLLFLRAAFKPYRRPHA
jgi:hypothetical protein